MIIDVKYPIILIVMLAAMSSNATAETTCALCTCFDGDHWKWEGMKVAEGWSVPTLTSVPDNLPADIQGLWIYNCAVTKLAENQFESYRHLQKIRIDKNKISQIEEGALRYMANITIISLYQNELTELPSDFLTYSPNIIEVSVYENKIKRLQTNMFSNLKYLKRVVLNDNEITTIEDQCFNNVPQLEEIHLHNNKLISLDVNFIDNLNTVKYILLNDNPWHCDASLCGVLDAVVSGAKWSDWDAPTCTTPQSFAGRSWSKELLTELCTQPRQLNHVPTDLPTDLAQLNLTGTSVPYKSSESSVVPATELNDAQ